MIVKLRLSFLMLVLIPQVIIFAMAHNSLLASDQLFSQIEALSLMSALLLALTMPGLLVDWLIGKPLGRMRQFCTLVKQGDYQSRLVLANQSRDKEDEDDITLLMRDMNWMARQIEIRETDLQQAIKELKESRQQMQQMALTDPLTSIANRRCFFNTLAQQVEALRCKCHPISLIMIDVDRFKNVNDTYGHEAGDKVLIELAGIIQRNSRGGDLAARVGGEEYALLLPDTDLPEAKGVAERIRAAVAGYAFILSEAQQITVNISLGICTISKLPCLNMEKLYCFADQALYYSKNNGRNSISVYDPDSMVISKVEAG
ncbi:MAG: diguanylate cyclase [Firmicutes bacterium]|nr:diguanylate cyclase [Bacillota bacterium]